MKHSVVKRPLVKRPLVKRPLVKRPLVKRQVALISLCLLVAACKSVAKVPGPLIPPDSPDAEAPGAPAVGPETIVVRHASPVFIYRPGATAGYRLTFHRQRDRVVAGGGVRSGYGGRVELLWPGDATSIVLFEQSWVWLGDPARDEPLVRMDDVTRAQLTLTPEDRIVLMGGADLRGDTIQPSGPFLVDRVTPTLLRVKNQSKLRGRLLYLDAVLELAPGDAIDLPILVQGTGPAEAAVGKTQYSSGGVEVDIIGNVEPAPGERAVYVRALELSEVSGQGVQVRLLRDEEAVFSSLEGRPTTSSPTPPAPGESSGTPQE